MVPMCNTRTLFSGNRLGLLQLFSSNIAAIRPSIYTALAVCLAGHLIHSHEEHREQHADSFQFTACALILLRDTGGGGVDVGTATVTLAELRSACVKNGACDWSQPDAREWSRVLQIVDRAFAPKRVEGACAASAGIFELAMVVGASKFIQTLLAPQPPAASFINATVSIPNTSPSMVIASSTTSSSTTTCAAAAYVIFKFGPIIIVNQKRGPCAEEHMQEVEEREGCVYTATTYAVRVDDMPLLKLLLLHGDGNCHHSYRTQQISPHPAIGTPRCPFQINSLLILFQIPHSLVSLSLGRECRPRSSFPPIKREFQHRLQQSVPRLPLQPLLFVF
jgi:hypothetical protein